jgi:hypothetical protein
VRAQVFREEHLQEKLEILQWFSKVIMTDRANQIFRTRTAVFGFAGGSRSPHISDPSQLEKYPVAAAPA